MSDEELVNKTIKMCEELIANKDNEHLDNELIINSLVNEHLSRVRRFNRIGKP